MKPKLQIYVQVQKGGYICWASTHKKTYGPCQWSAVLSSPQGTFQTSVSTKLLLSWPSVEYYQKRAILYIIVYWSKSTLSSSHWPY